MGVKYLKNNKVTEIIITYNEKDGEFIMELKKYFNYHFQKIRVRTTDSRYIYVNLMDIYYVEALDGRCLLYDDEHIYFAMDRFPKLKQYLSKFDFVQCNKTQIVNTHHIKEIEIYKDCQRILTLDNSELLLVSRRYKNSFDEYKVMIDPFFEK